MIFGEKFRKKYALSEAGEANVKRGVLWTVITNLLVMAGIGILYILMQGYRATLVDGAPLPKVPLYLLAVVAFLVLSFLTHYQQYHYTYSVVYDEVGYVRTSLADVAPRAYGRVPCAWGLLSPCARPLPVSWLCVAVLPPLRPLPPTYYIFRG